MESIDLNPYESVESIELNLEESIESDESVESIELNRFAVDQKRKTGACGSPRSPGCGSRTSTALGWSSTTRGPQNLGVNCRILPIIPVRVEMAINRSGSHRRISVKLAVGSTREGEVRSEAT